MMATAGGAGMGRFLQPYVTMPAQKLVHLIFLQGTSNERFALPHHLHI